MGPRVTYKSAITSARKEIRNEIDAGDKIWNWFGKLDGFPGYETLASRGLSCFVCDSDITHCLRTRRKIAGRAALDGVLVSFVGSPAACHKDGYGELRVFDLVQKIQYLDCHKVI